MVSDDNWLNETLEEGDNPNSNSVTIANNGGDVEVLDGETHDRDDREDPVDPHDTVIPEVYSSGLRLYSNPETQRSWAYFKGRIGPGDYKVSNQFYADIDGTANPAEITSEVRNSLSSEEKFGDFKESSNPLLHGLEKPEQADIENRELDYIEDQLSTGETVRIAVQKDNESGNIQAGAVYSTLNQNIDDEFSLAYTQKSLEHLGETKWFEDEPRPGTADVIIEQTGSWSYEENGENVTLHLKGPAVLDDSGEPVYQDSQHISREVHETSSNSILDKLPF